LASPLVFRPSFDQLLARPSTSGAIATPICFAVFKLITNSNFVGWLFGEHNSKVKGDRHNNDVDVQPRQRERNRPAQQDEGDGDVDGVSRVAI